MNADLLYQCQSYAVIFFTGGFAYCALEILYRGFSHITMFFAGGICFLLVGLIEHLLGSTASVISQMVFCGIMITCVELLFGLIINQKLHLNVWDYSKEQYNFQGQICLFHANMWFLLSGPMIFCYDLMRYLLLRIPLPHYKLF